jgi:IMP cyclohydrolase
MNVYELKSIGERIAGNPYVGRGIAIGMTADGKRAAAAYFIMGRSGNSRNRVFVESPDGIVIRPFDPEKLEDPSLVIYAPVRQFENNLIVTNGDQTDTVRDYLAKGESFATALESRTFEPDAPNYTPRISGMLTFAGEGFSYEMSILKSADPGGTACVRQHFAYPALPGVGHFLHTYVTDGDPIPSFVGEPKRITIPNSPDEFAAAIWENLDAENRVSLYVRYVDLASGAVEARIINKRGSK